MHLRYFIFAAVALSVAACNETNDASTEPTPAETAPAKETQVLPTNRMVTDNTIQVGDAVWYSVNLATETFRNGDPIQEAKSEDDWYRANQLQQPAWCYYNNDPAMGETYGKLYNWYACTDPRGLAPEGYKVPDDREWAILTAYFAELEEAGNFLKAEYGWNDRDDGTSGNGSNESGFSALPGGMRLPEGGFHGLGYRGAFWSTTEVTESRASSPGVSYNNDQFYWNEFSKGAGFTVRVIKDASAN